MTAGDSGVGETAPVAGAELDDMSVDEALASSIKNVAEAAYNGYVRDDRRPDDGTVEALEDRARDLASLYVVADDPSEEEAAARVEIADALIEEGKRVGSLQGKRVALASARPGTSEGPELVGTSGFADRSLTQELRGPADGPLPGPDADLPSPAETRDRLGPAGAREARERFDATVAAQRERGPGGRGQ